MKKVVTQEHGAGCAVACVACVLGISYQKALQLFSHPKWAYERGFYAKEVVEALEKGGVSYSYKKVNSKTEHLIQLPHCILFIKRSQKFPMGHYLVKIGATKWMNPWINYPLIAPAKGGIEKELPGEPQYVFLKLSPSKQK
jgi:hypothetical protein